MTGVMSDMAVFVTEHGACLHENPNCPGHHTDTEVISLGEAVGEYDRCGTCVGDPVWVAYNRLADDD